jgi:hypothetical protein
MQQLTHTKTVAENRRFKSITSIILVVLVAALCLPEANAQTIVVEGTASSGALAAAAGNDNQFFNYTNVVTGEFMVVTVAGKAAGNSVSNNYNSNNISVTYNNAAFTLGAFGTNSNDGFAGIWYLANPIADGSAHELRVDFGGDIFDNGTWEFGAISLSNVNESSPIAATVVSGASTSDQDFTITPNVSQTINAGDFLALANANQSVSTVGNQFRTASDGQTDFYDYVDTNGYSSIYQVLSGSDIVAGDVPITDVNDGNKYQARGLIFNAVPEPSTFLLLGMGLSLLAFRRRRF